MATRLQQDPASPKPKTLAGRQWHPARRQWHPALLGACVLVMLSGCPSWPAGRPLGPLLPKTEESEPKVATPPVESPLREGALRSPAVNERLAALQVFANATAGPLPVEVLDLRSDPDGRVRAAVLPLLARCRPPHALEYITAALTDGELQVRLAAVTALGELGGVEAQVVLTKVLQSETELPRAAAVSALANLNAQAAVMEAAHDRSWRVRLAVARALRRFPNPQGVALAHQLLADPSAGVQQEVVKAIADWPIEQAGPLLLAAMGRIGYTTRKTAAQQLSTRWPPAAEFPVDGPPERRAEVLAWLQQRFAAEIGPTEIALASATGVEESPDKQLAQQAALKKLVANDVLVRRRAAGDLARSAPLSPAAVAEVASLTLRETDPLVWQEILAAVHTDGSEPATRLACAALGHASPEVRRRACEYLAAHPQAEHVGRLLRALDDEHDQVVAAAARALGAVGRLDDPEPLRRRLTSTNELLRVDVAAALTRLGDPAGPAALERLTYSKDVIVRRQVAMVLGELAQPAFASHLIRLLDDRPDIRRAALESLPKVVGYDPTARAGQPLPRQADQVNLWREWFAQQQKGATSPPLPTSRSSGGTRP